MAGASVVQLPCKLVLQLPIKAGKELFHQIVATKPQNLVNASPGQVHACQVHEGDHGANGCITQWDYTIDGKVHMAKTMLEKVDVEKKTVTYKWVAGDFLDLYKHFSVTIHVETKEGGDFITYTVEYGLLKPDDPHPLSLLQFYVQLTNEIESHLSA